MKATIIIVCLLSLPALSLAEAYRCNVDGRVIYSQVKCADDAAALQMDPVPRDSLDNPDAAARYQMMQIAILQQQAAEAKERSAQDQEIARIQADGMARIQMNQQLERVNRQLRQIRVQQINQQILQPAAPYYNPSPLNSRMTCSPTFSAGYNMMGTYDCR